METYEITAREGGISRCSCGATFSTGVESEHLESHGQRKVKITELSNPAAVGWRWTGGTGAQYEVTWIRGSHGLLYAFTPTVGPNAGKWTRPMSMAQERWTHDGTLKGARTMAHEFINESESE